MEGVPEPPNLRGITPRAIEHIFRHIEGTPDKQFLVRASYLEIYNEEICDLLNKNYKNKLELRESPDSGVYVKDLSSFIIQDANEMKEKLSSGRKNRHNGETKMNKDSSRSHSIFSIQIETIELGIDGKPHVRAGKLNLVDLAGSERQSKTQAVGDRFKEAVNINQSLSTLGNVISALVDGKSTHVPYRDSKLTRLLQNSLGGNAKTVMVANIGPADYNYEETISTLRYANHAKSIKNKPKINEDPKDTMIREYQSEITRLKDELAKKLGGGIVTNPDGSKKKVIEVETIVKVEDEEKLREAEEKLNLEKIELQRVFEEQKLKIESQKNMAEDEKRRLIKALEDKEKKEQDLIQDRNNLINKIKQMEEKLLQGNKLKEMAKITEQKLMETKLALEKKEIEERRKMEELALKAKKLADVEQDYGNLLEEIDVKTRKLNTLVKRIDECKQQKNEIMAYRIREKEILLEENRALTREIKLMDLIIESFIPQEEVMKLEHRMEFNEEMDEWIVKEKCDESLKKIEKCPSALGLKRPMCKSARMAISLGDLNPRYKYDNIYNLDLELPEPTTEEFDGTLSQRLQETINIALNEDEDEINLLQSEGKPNVFIGKLQEVDGNLAGTQEKANGNSGGSPTKKKGNTNSKAVRPASGVKKK